MPIQLPQVQRIGSEAPESVGRIQTTVPDGRRDMAQTQGAVEGLAEAAIKYRNDIADQTADTTASDADSNYRTWHAKRLYGDPGDPANGIPATIGLVHQQGDPEENYRQFEKENKEKLNQLSAASDSESPWSQETQNLVNRRLSRRYEQLRVESLTEYGNQKNKYDDSKTVADVKLSQQSMVSASAKIDPAHPETMDPMRQSVAEVKNAIYAQGMRYGGVIKDPHGDEVYTDSAGVDHRVTVVSSAVKQKVQKEISDGLYAATDNLIKSGAPGAIQQAKALKDEYADKYFQGEQSGKLDAGMRKAKIEQDASHLALELQGKSPGQIEARLSEVDHANGDTDVGTKAREIIANNANRSNQLKKLRWDDNLQNLLKNAAHYKQTDPTASITDYEQTTTYKHLADQVNQKDLAVVQKTFNPPKTSDPQAIAEVQRILRETPFEDLQKMDRVTWARATSNLSAPQRTAADKELATYLNPSNTVVNSTIRKGLKELETQSFRSRLLTPDDDSGHKVRPGGRQDEALGKYQQELTPILRSIGPGATDDDITKIVHEFVISKVNNQPMAAVPKWHATGSAFTTPSDTPKAQAPATPKQTVNQINGRAIKDYTLEHGSPPNGPQLEAYKKADPKRYGQQ